MDLLGEVLSVGGVRGTVACRIEGGESWGVSWTDDLRAAFYAVTAGSAWLTVPGSEPIHLMAGDLLLMPVGVGHRLASSPETAAPGCTGAEVQRLGAGAMTTHILCASYSYDRAVSTQVLKLLPEIVHIRGDNGGTCLDDTVRLLARELAYPQIAGSVVLDRLVDILLVQLLRVWLAEKPVEAQGTWLGVLDDELIGLAMAKLHGEPARAWTTESLAAEIGVSRATLARRFLAVCGETPGGYLTRWRMDLAAVRLRDTGETVESIARAVGYTSVYAFSRAFRRVRGQAPGRYRTELRAAA